MLTVLAHYYNEEYLLPWWLHYHKQIFDHGILIDYGSNDKSNDIIREICPTWEIVPTKNQYFDAHPCDDEIKFHEARVSDYKMALNITEFLIGDIDGLLCDCPEQHHLRSYIMADPLHKLPSRPTYDKLLFNQCYFGVHDMGYRQSRILHRLSSYPYGAGRHSHNVTTDKACLLWYGLAPWNEKTIKRKLQIQHKISEGSMNAGFGSHHRTDRDKLNSLYHSWAARTQDLRHIINKLVVYEK